MAITRSAAFMRSLLDLAGKQAEIDRVLKAASAVRIFEAMHSKTIEESFQQIAAAARGGAGRLMLNKDDFLNTTEARAYMQKYGFTYNDGWHDGKSAIEWCYTKEALLK